MRTFKWRIALVLITGTLSGCAAGPLTVLGGCMAAAMRSVETGDSIEVECDLERKILLVALPDRVIAREELIAFELPANALEMLRGSEMRGARLCTVEEHKDAEAAPKVGENKNVLLASAECVKSPLHLDRVFVGSSQRFVLRIRGAPEGARLDWMTGLDE